jgi:hypothetical protein
MLRRFVGLSHEMRDSRFMQDAIKTPRTLGMESLPDGQVRPIVPQYDWENFRSFLTMFRKVAVAKSEPVYLPKVLKIVMRCSNDEARAAWKEGIRKVNAIIAGRYSAIQYGVITPHGRTNYTGCQVLEILINSLIFHEGEDKADDLLNLNMAEMGCHIFLVLGEIICPVLNTCIQLRNLMYRLQLLPESDFPPPDPE